MSCTFTFVLSAVRVQRHMRLFYEDIIIIIIVIVTTTTTTITISTIITTTSTSTIEVAFTPSPKELT